MATSGIDFIIGGKDKAKPAFSSVEAGLGRIENKIQATSGATASLAKVSATLVVAYGLLKAALAALGGVNNLNAAFDKQTESVRQLTSALRARSAAGDASSQQLQQMAKDLQAMTGIGDEVTLGLMQQAAAMGFATDRIDDAAKAAIGLSDVTGKDLGASMSDLKSALEGNFEAFHQLNPQILYMRTNQEKLNAVLQMAQQGLTDQSENMTTVAGASRRASSAFADLKTSVGKLFAPFRVLLNAGIQQVSESLIQLLAPAVEYVRGVMQNIGPTVIWLKTIVVNAFNVMITAFTAIEMVIKNTQAIWELFKATAALAMTSLAETAKYYFTEVIPAYFNWFAENFVAIFRDAFNAVTTMLNNLGKNIGEAVFQIYDWIASGMEGGPEELMRRLGEATGTALLDGFKSTVTALPEIAARQLTANEQALKAEIDAITKMLGDNFDEKLKGRLLKVQQAIGADAMIKDIQLKSRPQVITQGIQATQGRLLTRGPASWMMQAMEKVTTRMQNLIEINKQGAAEAKAAKEQLNKINENTARTTQLVPVV